MQSVIRPAALPNGVVPYYYTRNHDWEEWSGPKQCEVRTYKERTLTLAKCTGLPNSYFFRGFHVIIRVNDERAAKSKSRKDAVWGGCWRIKHTNEESPAVKFEVWVDRVLKKKKRIAEISVSFADLLQRGQEPLALQVAYPSEGVGSDTCLLYVAAEERKMVAYNAVTNARQLGMARWMS